MLLIVCVVLFICISRKTPEQQEVQKYEILVLVSHVKDYFNEKIVTKTGNRRLTEIEELKRERMRLELQKAIRSCSYGDWRAKAYVKKQIKDWLINRECKEQEELEKILPFTSFSRLTVIDRFDLLLYDYKKRYGLSGIGRLIEDCLAQRQDKNRCEIGAEELNSLYELHPPFLNYDDKAEIVAQRIYQYYKGYGVIDELRDMEIDGVSGGVSGIAAEEYAGNPGAGKSTKGLYAYDSIWVFYKGTMLRLAFLSFGSQKELERVCKNVYRYNSPGQLSAVRGYIANEMKDGSRVVVVRPPFAESWAFFIRKFGKKESVSIGQLIRDKNSEVVIALLRWIVTGCQVFGITGEQGCGKTTLLRALIEFIPADYTLRIQELLFELHLREQYPERNIVSFKETEEISGREGLDLQKKTDGTVNIIGEVATAAVAGWLVMISQVASRFTIFTHHAKTTDSLIYSIRNDLMASSGFHDERIAEKQVREAIRFDVHLLRRADGHRTIERITEIIRMPEKEGCSYRDIIVLTAEGYKVVNHISEDTKTDMCRNMNEAQQQEFLEYNGA